MMKKIFTLAILVMSFVFAQNAFAGGGGGGGETNHYYWYSFANKVTATPTGAGFVYQIVGTTIQDPFTHTDMLNDSITRAQGLEENIKYAKISSQTTGFEFIDENNKESGAKREYSLCAAPAEGYEFVGWMHGDEMVSTDALYVGAWVVSNNFLLDTTSPLTMATDVEDPHADEEGWFTDSYVAVFQKESATGVEAIDAKQVASVKYVDLQGRVSDTPFDGVNIVVTNYADGTQSAVKAVK